MMPIPTLIVTALPWYAAIPDLFALFRCMFDVIFVTHTSYDDNTSTASDDTTLVRCHTRLAVCTCCACFPKHMMMMYQQFPRIWYVMRAV